LKNCITNTNKSRTKGLGQKLYLLIKASNQLLYKIQAFKT